MLLKQKLKNRRKNTHSVCFPNLMQSLLKYTPKTSLLLLQRLVDGFIFIVLVMISVTFYYQPSKLFPRKSKSGAKFEEIKAQSYWKFLTEDYSDDGFSFPRRASGRERFVTYEPPVGDWNKQLLAFENAVVIAKMLNRTLLAHSLISEREALRVQKARIEREKFGKHSQRLLEIDPKYTVPLSAVLDLKYLTKLIEVRLTNSSYIKFVRQLENLTLHEVCHHGVLGIWVDFTPSPENTKAWNVLEAQQFSSTQSPIGEVDYACDGKLEIASLQEKPTSIWRSILTELLPIKADIISFKGSSLATQNLRFLSKKRVRSAQSWILRYIRFSSYTQERVRRIVNNIKGPYNALVISNNSNSQTLENILNFRLREMEKKQFRRVTKRLFVFTDLHDLRFLKPLELLGYEIYPVNKMIPSGIIPHIRRDIVKLLGSLICKYARLFVGPLDSHLIQRARVYEARQKDGLLTEQISVRWAMHTMRRKFKILRVESNEKEHRNDSNTMTHNLRAMVCGMCKQMTTSKNACQKFSKQCLKS